jgi:hypothetical protein
MSKNKKTKASFLVYSLSTSLALVLLGAQSGCSNHDHSDGAAGGQSGDHSHADHPHGDHFETIVFYTCSMHPQIREDEPGRCPICHMPLVKMEVEKGGGESSEIVRIEAEEQWYCQNFPNVTSMKPDVCPLDGSPMIKRTLQDVASEKIAEVRLRQSQVGHFRSSLFPATRMNMSREIRLLGSVLQSEEKQSFIPARVPGRVERVYIKSAGSFIQKGDPVVDIYSPELISSVEEYLVTRKTYEASPTPEFKDLLERSEQRLLLWGVLRSQIDTWYRNQNVPRNITLYSPTTGIVQKRNATEGGYVQEGANLFELSDLSEVWVAMDVYEHDAALVQLGQGVRLEFTAIPGRSLESEIDFVSPFLDSATRTLKVRATIQNLNGQLKPGMVVSANLKYELPSKALAIPRSAIIDTGKRKVVWVKTVDNRYQARVIQTGFQSDGFTEVVRGLEEGQAVVVEGNFLLDAQARLFGGYEDPPSEPVDPHAGH